jgi:U3 small nucleolar RNA-associated protein 13
LYEENVSIVNLNDDATAKLLFKEDQDEPVACFCFHPTKDEIVVASNKSLISHWSTTGEGCIRSFKGHQMPILAMTFDPSGTLVATASADRTVRVWDIAGGFCTHSFKDHTDIARTVQFHPDPQRLHLFSTGEDNTIRVFDLRQQKCIATIRDHVSLPTALAFGSDGILMATCGRDKVIFRGLMGSICICMGCLRVCLS